MKLPGQEHSIQSRSPRPRHPQSVHRPHRATLQTAIQQPQAVIQTPEIPKQHWTLQIHMATENEQHTIRHQVVDRHQIPGLHQRNKALRPLPDGKTRHHWRRERDAPEQKTRTNIQVPPWKQILPTKLQKRRYINHPTTHQRDLLFSIFWSILNVVQL